MKSTVIGIVVAGVVLGGGYLAYSKYTPQVRAVEVLDRVFSSTSQRTTYTSKGTALLDITAPSKKGDTNDHAVVKYAVSGLVDKSVPDSFGKSSGRLDLDINVEGSEGLVTKLAIDSAMDDKVLYLKLDLPAELLAGAPAFISGLNNTWIKIDLNEFAKKGLITEEALATISDTGKLDDPVTRGKLKEMVVKSGFFVDLSMVPGEDIDGLPTYKLTTSIDPLKLADIMIGYLKIVDPEALAKLTEEEKASLEEMEKRVAEFLKSSTISLVVEKDSALLRVVSGNVIFDDPESKAAGAFDFTVEYKDINKPVNIELPKESTSIIDILAPFFGAFM